MDSLTNSIKEFEEALKAFFLKKEAMSYMKRHYENQRTAQEWWEIACNNKHFYNINIKNRSKCVANQVLAEQHLLHYWTASKKCRSLIRQGEMFNEKS